MVLRPPNDLLAACNEKRTCGYHQCRDPQVGQGGECWLDFAFAAHIDDMNSLAQSVPRLFRVPRLLATVSAGRIDEHSDDFSLRHQFAEYLQAFR